MDSENIQYDSRLTVRNLQQNQNQDDLRGQEKDRHRRIGPGGLFMGRKTENRKLMTEIIKHHLKNAYHILYCVLKVYTNILLTLIELIVC